MQTIRLELAKEEAAEAAAGKVPLHKVSLTKFLSTGFELEDQQWVSILSVQAVKLNDSTRYQLRRDISDRKLKSTKRQADIQEKRTMLLTQIHNWRQAQMVYIPHAAILVASTTATDENETTTVQTAENVPLFLPSALPEHVRLTLDMKKICQMEIRLRQAEAHDALFEIRKGRRKAQWLWQFKKVNISGMGNKPNTKAVTIYLRINRSIQRAADKYRRARSALLILDPNGAWKENLKELRNEDIRGPGKGPDENKISNGRFETSWIWLVVRLRGGKSNMPMTEDEFNESMGVEWAKQRARVMRWKEEKLIVQEEMRRVLAWFEWRGNWWEQQATRRENGQAEILQGVAGYAYKQASIQRRLQSQFGVAWLEILQTHGIKLEWAEHFKDQIHQKGAVKKREKGKNIEEGQEEDLGREEEGDSGREEEENNEDKDMSDNEERLSDESDDEELIFDD